jgi:hypothetical protein
MAGYPADLKAGYLVRLDIGYRISGQIFLLITGTGI